MDLVDWRERNNQVDSRILDLLNERVSYVLNLAPLKRQEGIPIHEPKREAQVLDNIKAQNRGPLNNEAVCRIFKAVMAEMKVVQAEQNEIENDGDTENRMED